MVSQPHSSSGSASFACACRWDFPELYGAPGGVLQALWQDLPSCLSASVGSPRTYDSNHKWMSGPVQWGKERVGRMERVALTYLHCHEQNRWLVGSCPIAQGGALWWPQGVGWVGAGMKALEGVGDVSLLVVDSLHSTARTDATLQSNYLPIKN